MQLLLQLRAAQRPSLLAQDAQHGLHQLGRGVGHGETLNRKLNRLLNRKKLSASYVFQTLTDQSDRFLNRKMAHSE
ncbi:MAG: hypothetical protein Q4E66_00435 [Comamonadaceae bacterium]|nr:hypothetical protein [Comamonadaceae bacterium]